MGETLNPLRLKMIHEVWIKELQSDRGSCIIWFKSGFQSAYRESFDLDRDFGESSQTIWDQNFAYRRTFDSDRDLGVPIANHLFYR